MSAVLSSFKRAASNPRRFDKPSQLNDRIWKHCKNQARRLVSKTCLQFDARKKKIIKLCSASRMTFRARFYRTDPQNIGGQFGPLSGFLRNTFRKQTSQKKPRDIFRTEKFQDYFWEMNANFYSLAALLLGLAKSIYFFHSRCSYLAELFIFRFFV